ncbi:MAG: VOC family protein [Chitinophagales bacterium]|nr:VOC family protein [Chitinophagales bacterium]
MQNANALNWFEIPATDINRAKTFYETIFGIDMGEVVDMMGMQMVMFPVEPTSGKVGGGLAQSAMHKPSHDGSIVYLNANEAGMQNVLDRIENAGGQIAMPRTKISDDIGYMAFFIDSEGNKMALHSGN